MTESSDILKEYKNRRVTVIGAGISNRPLISLLIASGAYVTVRDKKELSALGEELEELAREKKISLVLGEGYLDGIDEEVIFKTPGVRYDEKELVRACEKGAALTSEMQLFFEKCPATIIGITGSDGKTTTTNLIGEILKASGKKVYLGGNLGTPLLPRLSEMTSEDYAVVELSSFQLHTMTRSPDIAVITNISPNHLDYHKDMNEYISAKMNILAYQKNADRAVLNYSSEETKKAIPLAHGEAVAFSSKEKPLGGLSVYENDGYIYFGDEQILKTADIKLPGRHNVENYMAAIAALYGIVPKKAIETVAKTFGGVEHRLEFVREFNGVKYYNSSIDSSPTRTLAALSAFSQKLIVIMGGYDKNLSYDVVGTPLSQKAKAVILTGATAEKIKTALLSSPEYKKDMPVVIMKDSYFEAILAARDIAKEGDIVLLSPASASFDSFKNFEERGRFFKNTVNSF